MSNLIERQAAIDEIKAIYEYHDTVTEERIIDHLKRLPSAQPEQRWIPCSEMVDLPDYDVLCCDRYGEELIGWLSCSEDQWFCESDEGIMYDPVAWMPLPEPYREERRTDG